MDNNNQFLELGLSDDLLNAITKKGFEKPSPIQALTIPFVLNSDKDFIAQAQTGTGKTAAFGLPILQVLESKRTIPQALVLVPTRELALQVTQEMQSFNSKGLSITPIYGGASIEEQLRRLRKGADIVVGTPGRILDHIRRKTLNLSELQFLVLDEADEMLNMGFIEDIELIMSEMPESKRVLLFSATMPDRIASLVHQYMNEPELLKVESTNITADLTNQIYFEVRENDKFDALTRIIDVESDFYGIVFSRTKVGVDDVVHKLIARGYSAEGLHGDISQAQREKILQKFKQKLVNILVATDVAARGIDVNNLTHVVNYSLPQDNESYVHRIGRTGRAGNQGTAITFISPSEARQFGFLKRQLKAEITREQIPSSADVVAVKRTRIKDELAEIIGSESFSDSLPMAMELLQENAPEVVLAALLRLAYKNELSESNYPEIRSISVDRKGKAKICIALGTDDGYTARMIVKLLKQECRMSDHDIDDVTVMDSYSFVTVPYGEAQNIAAKLNQSSGGTKIAEVSKEKVEDFGGRGGRGRRDRRGGGGRRDGGDRDRRRSGGGDRRSGGGYSSERREGGRSGERRGERGAYVTRDSSERRGGSDHRSGGDSDRRNSRGRDVGFGGSSRRRSDGGRRGGRR